MYRVVKIVHILTKKTKQNNKAKQTKRKENKQKQTKQQNKK